MSSPTAISALQQIQDQLDQLSGVHGNPALLHGLISAALKVPAPAGDVKAADARANTYLAATATTDGVIGDLSNVVRSALPAAWRGAGAESAAQALQAVALQGATIRDGFDDGHRTLSTWVGHLKDAQKRDGQGRSQLNDALGLLPPLQAIYMPRFSSIATSKLPEALGAAISGCKDLVAAAQLSDSAAQDAIKALNQSAGSARARQIGTTNVDPLTAVTLAYADPKVLDSTAMTRGSLKLDAMSAADRAAFEKLLSGAQSPTEAEYLWKALAADYSAADITSFDKVIHPHGNDLAWLDKHLNPNIGDPNTTPGAAHSRILSYDGVRWYPAGPGTSGAYEYYSQGGYGDCVAASVTVASLSRDPVRMLGVTTGLGPAAVTGGKDDSSAAVHARLQNLYLQNYADGQKADGAKVFDTTKGIGGPGQSALDTKMLTPSTGSTYQLQPLNDAAARAAALPSVHAAAEIGKPVPIGVEGQVTTVDHSIRSHPEFDTETAYHQMVVVGASGDELEIYNPWGNTTWVTDQQFIDGQIGAATSDSPGGGLPTPDEVHIPH
ncbi:MAG: hypothetical protein JWN03_6472 [Nocardia sp.]|uniref:hypothetical protein n=1 Tax=Nocardia sp. TaxID=1821 RepID=UPI0026167E0D|nr:hypothetical protein [Nocardia sp.]MCU1646197.1 hypothetical protein [Nocardia sp.]